MKTVGEFQTMKESGKKISVVTCYDYWSACILDETDVDAVLVGDSAAMVIHGYKSTVNAEIEMMCYHAAAVKKGIGNKFITADVPFLIHANEKKIAIDSIDRLMKAGANAVKIEGADGNSDLIQSLVKSGVPVMGHLGLTPQSVNRTGGFKVQGTNQKSFEKILTDAHVLQDAGCFSIVLELVPANLTKKISEELSIPTIGIGAGKYADGQVLVLHDLMGFTKDFSPKFLRKYADGFSFIKQAVNKYSKDVKNNNFPSDKESY